MPLDQTTNVQPVVVMAARLPRAAGDPAFSIIEIDPLQLRQSSRLDDALAAAPGFSLYRRTSSLGANPTTQGVSLRAIAGSAASRALVTLDGVPQNDPFGGWVIWTSLPAETISGAAIVRGAGAGPYGAGALTGVVTLEQPSHIDGGTVIDVKGGSLGYARAAGVTEIAAGPARVFLDASGEHSDGWIPVIQGRGSADRALSLTDWSAAERVELPIGREVLSERVGLYQEDRGAGVLFAGSRARGVRGNLTLVAPPDDGQLGWRLQAWLTASDLANSSASVSANRDTATLADDEYATPAIGLGLNAAVRRHATDYSWELGLDVRDFDGESRDRLFNQGVFTGARTGGGGELVAGAYAEASRTLGPLLLTGGLRLDGWEDYNSKLVQTGAIAVDQRPPDRGGVAPTGRLGVRDEISDHLYARAALYAGFRPATLNELHRPFRVGNDVTEANAQLQPERLYGAEIGFGGKGLFTWDADLFYNRLEDAVTNVTIGKGPGTFPLAGFVPAGGTLFERENAGSVDAFGGEVDTERAVSSSLTVRAALTYTHTRVDGGGQAPQLTGLRPALTPAFTVTAGLDWYALDRLILSGQIRYQTGTFDDDLNTRPIDGGALIDARAEWRLTGAMRVFVAAENIADARLQTGHSAAGVVTWDAPRLVRVGLSYRL